MATNTGSLFSGTNFQTMNRALGETVKIIDNISKTTVKATSSMASFAVKASGLSGTFKGVSSIVGQLGSKIEAAFSIDNIKNFASECLELGSALTEVQNVVDVTFTTLNEKVNNVSKSMMQTAGLSETAAKQMMGTYGAMAQAYGLTEEEAEQMAETITQLTGDVASFYNKDIDKAYTKMKSIFTGETEPLKEFGIIMTNAMLNEYAMSKGIGKTVEQMTAKEKLLLRNQYVTEKLANASGDFVRTEESWANQTRLLELRWESFKASIGQGLINIFTPTINILNQLIAKLGEAGSSFENFTKKVMKLENNEDAGGSSIASAYAEAAEAINETHEALKRTTSSIDDIHKVSGNGNKEEFSILGLPDLTKKAEETKKQSKDYKKIVDDAVENIQKAWENGDFTNIGKSVGEKINIGMKTINEVLPEIQETARKVGTSVASFFNGIMYETDFETVGENIAGFIKTKLYLVKGFLEEFDFKQLGKTLADGLRGLFAEGEDGLTFLDLMADNIKLALNGLSDTIIEFCDGTDFKDLGKKISNAITRLFMPDENGESVTTKGSKALAKIFNGVINIVVGIVSNWEMWGALCTALHDGIITLIENIDWEGVNDAFIGCFTGLLGILGVILDLAMIPVKKLGENVEGFWNTMFDLIKLGSQWVIDKISGTWNDIVAGFKLGWKYVKEVFNDVGSFFSGIFNKIKDIFSTIGDTIGDAVSGAFKGAINWILEKAVNLINGFIHTVNNCIGILNDIPGVNISEISDLDVPKLAQGGYVGPNMPQLAVIGDNKREGEIVSPESKIRENTTIALTEFFSGQFLQQLGSAIAGAIKNVSTGNVEVKNYIDGEQLAEIIRSEIIIQTARGGM